MRSTRQFRAQLEAGYTLLSSDTTTFEKLEKVKTLLTGINPNLDQKLEQVSKAYLHLGAAGRGDIVHLSAHGLPETTPEEKRRKKALVFFISSYKSLRSEVGRVQGYYDNAETGSTSSVASVAKTGLFAKGPFGFITLAAIVIVGIGLLLKQSTTIVEIENIGCPPLAVPAELPYKIPGLHLPQKPIVSGIPDTVTLPKLTVSVRSTNTSISATILGQTGSYSLPARVTDVSFDNISLLNQTTILKLGSSTSHKLVIECK